MNADQLRRKRGAIKAKLTLAKNFADRIVEDLDATTTQELESPKKFLDEAYVKFQAISEQLSGTTVDEKMEQRDLDEEIEFEKRHTTIRAILVRCLDTLKPSTSTAGVQNEGQVSNAALAQLLEQQIRLMQQFSERSTDIGGNEALLRVMEQQNQMMEQWRSQSGTSRESQVKLPIIKLPTFSGNIEEWKRYADTFKTLIHNSDLSNIQKYQYLVGSLSGAAAKVMESIEISDQNYTIARELLKGRYEDKRAIRKRHIQCLFELPQVHRESVNAIRELVDHIQRHLRVLHSLKLPTEHWGEMIVYLVEKI